MKKVIESILALIKDGKLEQFDEFKNGKLSQEDFVEKLVNIVLEQLDQAKAPKRKG